MTKHQAVDEQTAIDQNRATKQDNQETLDALKINTRDGQQSMQVRVHSPFRNYYDGFAYSLTAENATGVFDILPRHHKFISLLLPCELIVRTVREGELKISISGGLIHVKADQVTIFLDI